MASLSTHLRTAGDHGRLAFHPDCPVCHADRLHGRLDPGGVVSLRAQALVTTGVVALSGISPVAALAAETDQEHEGSTPAEQVAAPEVEVDPGGEDTMLPVGAPTPVNSESEDPASALEPELTDSPADPASELEPAPQSQAPAPEPAPPVPLPPTSPPVPATSPPVPVAQDPTVSPPPVSSPSAGGDAPSKPRARLRKATAKRHAQVRIVAATTPQPSRTVMSAAPVAAPVPVAVGDRAGPDSQRHTVRPGESLWSISQDMLGPDASPADVARQVHRLWELNSQRIATGDPDLLMTGTRLRLR